MKNSIAFPQLLDCRLLADLPEHQKIDFLDGCATRRHGTATEILSQGEPAPGMFVIARGAVEVSYCDSQGNVSLIHVAGPGDVLGDVEAISENPCAASCTARPDTVVLCCPTPLLFQHLQSVVFVRNLTGIFYERMVRDNRSKAASQFYSVEQRLQLYLYDLTDETRPNIRASQSMLAEIIGCSRQTVNRKLGELREADVIRLGKGTITVLNRASLQEKINEGQVMP